MDKAKFLPSFQKKIYIFSSKIKIYQNMFEKSEKNWSQISKYFWKKWYFLCSVQKNISKWDLKIHFWDLATLWAKNQGRKTTKFLLFKNICVQSRFYFALWTTAVTTCSTRFPASDWRCHGLHAAASRRRSLSRLDVVIVIALDWTPPNAAMVLSTADRCFLLEDHEGGVRGGVTRAVANLKRRRTNRFPLSR